MAKSVGHSSDAKPTAAPANAEGFVGLINQGATCYLSSLLQSLYMTPEFRAMLSALGLQAKPHESDAVFGMLDDNGSRVLDFKELQNALRLAKQAAALGGQARGQERTRRPSKLTVEVGDGRGSPVAEQPSKPPPKPPSRPPPHKPNQRLKDAGQAAVSAVRDRVAANQGAARGKAARPKTR